MKELYRVPPKEEVGYSITLKEINDNLISKILSKIPSDEADDIVIKASKDCMGLFNIPENVTVTFAEQDLTMIIAGSKSHLLVFIVNKPCIDE